MDTKKIMMMEIGFAKSINQDKVSFHQLMELPSLWYNAKWHPSEKIVLAIVKYYANKAETSEKDADAANTIVNKLKDSLYNRKDGNYNLPYNIIGRFPPENFYYFKISSTKLKEALKMSD